VRRVLTFAMIWLVLAACLVCPVMQIFDHWDHEFQTGQDTESTFIVLALCIGAAIAFARTLFHISRALWVRRVNSAYNLLCGSLVILAGVILPAFLSASPPSTILRI